MYEVSVQAQFSAAHRVRLPDGELEPLHGHDWKVTATFAGPELDASGMLVDFVLAEWRLREIVTQLHHADLNTVSLMRGLNPTAEYVAKRIFDSLAEDESLRTTLARVAVTEAPGCVATYLSRGPRAD